MRDTLVSVVIPTYRRPDYLPRALRSVLKQTHERLEVIVVDDNAEFPEARDRVRAMVEALGDSRVRLAQNQRNLGGALSRNVGIDMARGDYIAFLDDDDEYLPRRIERQLERFHTSELQNLALVYCHTVMILPGGETGEEYRYTYRGHCVFEGMRDCIAATSQWMCKREALRQVGCFSDVPCKQDSNVIVKLLTAGYTVDYVPEILSRYYQDVGSGISHQGHQKRIQGEEALRSLCRAHYGLISSGQQSEVEYAFACRLIGHYQALGMKREHREALGVILRKPLRHQSIGALKRAVLRS